MDFVKLKKLLEDKIIYTISPTYKLKNDEIFERGRTPVISQDKEQIAGYSSLIDKKLTNPPYLLFGDHTEVFKWCKTNFVQGADGLKIFDSNSKSFLAFLFYALKACYHPSGFYERHYSKLIKTRIPVMTSKQIENITNVLYTYDKLIENNNKRIAILEQEVEEIYKEWFVRFRFPGYEKLKFVDGLPFEWSYARFKDIATIIRGVSYSSDEIDVPEGNYLVNLKNIRSYGGYNFNEEKTYIGSYKGTQTLTKLDLIMGVTDMTQDRRCVGSVALCPEFDKPAIISADLIKILSKYSNVFLYCHLKFGNYSKYISEFANGANVLHLRPKYLENIKILMPSKDLIEKFSSICIPIFNNILNLANQNNNLQNQRDYLLPRLMSGKLEVK